MAIPLVNMSKPLNNLGEAREDSYYKLKYATIFFLPENETTQELKSCCSGIVIRNVEIFQRYINQRYQNNKNPFLQKKTYQKSI